MIDTSRISSSLWKENFLILLGFPQPAPIYRGYVPLRVVAREFFYFEYDPRQEGQILSKVPAGAGVNGITDLGFVAPTLLGSNFLTGKPFNVFSIDDKSKMYQLFMGISPAALRVVKEMPASTAQNTLELDRWAANKMEFGWIDGFESPFLNPSPQSEIDIVPNIDFALGYANPIPFNVDPLLMFYVNHLQVAVVEDVNLVAAMLAGKVPVSIRTIGGLTTYNFPVDSTYDIEPIPLGASANEIAAALGVAGPISTSSNAVQPSRGYVPPNVYVR